MTLLRTLRATAPLLLCACAPVDPDRLPGTWTRVTDEGASRWFVFRWERDETDLIRADLAPLGDPFQVFEAAPGGGPVEVQTGVYAVQDDVLIRLADGREEARDDVLVTEVLFGAGTGQVFGNAILRLTADTLVLTSASDPDGETTWERAPDGVP